MNEQPIKDIVKKKYDVIAEQSKEQNESSCCGSGPSGCCGNTDYSMFNDDYSHIKGYTAEADLGLGCGIPTDFAGIKSGNVVLDLGSGALQKNDYLDIIKKAGFESITIHKQKEIIMPDNILLKYMTPLEVAAYKADDKGIFSITVSAKK